MKKVFLVSVFLLLSFSAAAAEFEWSKQDGAAERQIVIEAKVFSLKAANDYGTAQQIAYLNEQYAQKRMNTPEEREQQERSAVQVRQLYEAALRGSVNSGEGSLKSYEKTLLDALGVLSESAAAPVKAFVQQRLDGLKSDWQAKNSIEKTLAMSDVIHRLDDELPVILTQAYKNIAESPELGESINRATGSYGGGPLYKNLDEMLRDPRNSDYLQLSNSREIINILKDTYIPGTRSFRAQFTDKEKKDIVDRITKNLRPQFNRLAEGQAKILKQFSDGAVAFAQESDYRRQRAGASGAITLSAFVLSAVDADLARQVSAVGKASLQVSDAIRGCGTDFQWGRLADMSALLGNFVSIGTNLVGTLLGSKSTEQIILEEVRRIKDHLKSIEVTLDKRFGEVDKGLAYNYSGMIRGFESLEHALSRQDFKLEEVLLGFSRLGLDLNQMEGRLSTQVEVLAERQKIKEIYPILALLNSKESQSRLSYAEFHSYMETTARMALYDSGEPALGGRPLVEQPHIKTPAGQHLLNQLNTYGRDPGIAKAYPLLTEFAADVVSLANPEIMNRLLQACQSRGSVHCSLVNPERWAEAVKLYMALGNHWPRYMRSLNRQNEISQMLQMGEDLQNSIRTFTRHSDSLEQGHHKALFESLFKNIDDEKKALSQIAQQKYRDAVMSDYRGVDIFASKQADFKSMQTVSANQDSNFDHQQVARCADSNAMEPQSWGHRQYDFHPEAEGWWNPKGKMGDYPYAAVDATLTELRPGAILTPDLEAFMRLAEVDGHKLSFCYEKIYWESKSQKVTYFQGDNDGHEKASEIGTDPVPLKDFPKGGHRVVVEQTTLYGDLVVEIRLNLHSIDGSLGVARLQLVRSYTDKPYHVGLVKREALRPASGRQPDAEWQPSGIPDVYFKTHHGLVGNYPQSFADVAKNLSFFMGRRLDILESGSSRMQVRLNELKSVAQARFLEKLVKNSDFNQRKTALLSAVKGLEGVVQIAMPTTSQSPAYRALVANERRISVDMEEALTLRKSTVAAPSDVSVLVENIGHDKLETLKSYILDGYFKTDGRGVLLRGLPEESNFLIDQTMRELAAFQRIQTAGHVDLAFAIEKIREMLRQL